VLDYYTTKFTMVPDCTQYQVLPIYILNYVDGGTGIIEIPEPFVNNHTASRLQMSTDLEEFTGIYYF